jgi:hypothetical protein
MTTIYLKATSGSLTSACSNAVAVGGGPATHLVYTTQPSTPNTAGVSFTQQPVVAALDDDGYADYLHTSNMSLSVYSDASCTTPLSGGTLSGASVTPVAGTGTYAVLKYTKAATIYLKASSGSLTPTCSSAVVINPGAATKLSYTTEPASTAVAGVDFTRQPIVVAMDAYNNVDPTFSGTVTLSAYTSGSCSTSASGTTNDGVITAASGTATFTGVDFTKASTVYFKASSTGLSSDCSNSVTVTAAPATQLSFTTQPSANGVMGVNLKVQPVVTALDPYGNTDLTYNATVTLNPFIDAVCSSTPATGLLNGTANVSNGVYTFSNTRYSLAETIYMQASSGALTPSCSGAVALIPYVPIMFRGF